MYYAGNHYEGDKRMAATYMRTSTDLINWSDYKIVAYNPAFGTTRWDFECPHVVEKEGYYYLFITRDYPGKKTAVYRSTDPEHFGIGLEDAKKYYIGEIAVGAPEVIEDTDGNEYITSNHDLHGGTSLCPLRWEED